MLEYYFGTIRCRGNADNLTVCQMKQIAGRTSAFMKWCGTNGFVTGSKCKSYTTAHVAADSQTVVLGDKAFQTMNS